MATQWVAPSGTKITISVTGMDAIFQRMDQLGVERITAVSRTFEVAAENCKMGARKRAPVSKDRKNHVGGFMRSVIDKDPLVINSRRTTITAVVRAKANYSAFVELGTYKMKAQPFLYPAFVEAGQQLLDDLRNL